MSEDARLCPSARCEEGAVLLGIVGPRGVVGYVRPEVKVDEAFVEEARAGRVPEKRFRFAQPCVEGNCGHWLGEKCAVVDRMIELQDSSAVAAIREELPRCSIRSRCRWFSQRGGRACLVCPYVVTNLLADGTQVDEAVVPLAAAMSLGESIEESQ